MGMAVGVRRSGVVLFMLLGLVGGCRRDLPTTLPASTVAATGVAPVEGLRLAAAPPGEWVALPTRQNILYTHKQWRSPTKATGFGAVYIRLPLPLPVGALVWMARNEYAQRSPDGQVLGEWQDASGRRWFEARNDKFEVRGYAFARGTEGWIVYSGRRLSHPERPDEIALARQCVDSVLLGPTAIRPDAAADAGE